MGKREVQTIVIIVLVALILLIIVLSVDRQKENVSFAPEKINQNTYEGTLEVLAIDEFDNSRIEYFLNTAGKRYELNLPEEIPLISGVKVKVKGDLIENKILVSFMKDFEITGGRLGPPESAPVGGEVVPEDVYPLVETLGEQKVAVILIGFSDSPGEPFSVEQINNSIFNGPFQDFIIENSFGKTWAKGNTFGWYYSDDACNYSGVDIEEAIAVSDDDIYFPDYDRIIIIIDSFCSDFPGGGATIGKVMLESDDGPFRASEAILGNPYFYEPIQLPSGGQRSDNLTSGIGLTLHEFGHNLGVWHANTWECGDEILYGDCLSGGYGSVYDVMSRGWVFGEPYMEGNNFENNSLAAFHFSSPFKNLFKWIDKNSVLEITKNGTYVLKPLENSNAVIAEVKQENYPQLWTYHLEYRIPFGFDESLNDPLSRGNLGGIFINRQRELGGDPQIELLDMTPTTDGLYDEDWYNVALMPRKEFFDEGTGIKIKNLRTIYQYPSNSSVVIFSVEFFEPKCVRFLPSLETEPLFGKPIVASPCSAPALYGSGDVRNVDTIMCPDSTFEYNIVVPEGWSYVTESEQFILAPQQSISPLREIIVPREALPGNYTINISVTNLNSSLTTEGSFNIEVVGEYESLCGEGHIDNCDGTCTAVFTSANGDGYIGVQDLSWDNAHEATSGNADYTSTIAQIEGSYLPPYKISRTFLPFDTASITNDMYIRKAILNFWTSTSILNYDDDNDFLVFVETHQQSPYELLDEDFDEVYNQEGSERLDISELEPNTNYNLSISRLYWIEEGGWTLLGIREGHDLLDVEPEGINFVEIQTSESANPPQLIVIYRPRPD